MECNYCGNEIDFRSDRPNRIYCNRICRYKSLGVEIHCDECNVPFRILKSDLKRDTNQFHFCSQNCKNNSNKFKEYLNNQKTNSDLWNASMQEVNRIYEKGVHYSPETEFKKGWSQTEWGKELIKKRAKSLGNKEITKPEEIIKNIIEQNSLPFMFVGDGQFIVDTKYPDFIYKDKGNKIIEVFSDYWHREDVVKYWHQTEEGTKKYYNDRGYNVLVIWEREINKENKDYILKKIKDFLDTTIEIKLSEDLYKEFTSFAEAQFEGNRGLLLKELWDKYKEINIYYQNFDIKLNHIIQTLEQSKSDTEKMEKKPESIKKMLDGRTVLKGGNE